MAEQQEDIRATAKVGTRVLVKEKGLEGTVRFVGTTLFAPGKWIGLELNEAKGKNNGNVQGKQYFLCPENHGLFVRQNQIQLLERSPPQSRIPHIQSHLPLPSGIPRRSASFSGKRSPTTGGSPPQPLGKLSAGRKSTIKETEPPKPLLDPASLSSDPEMADLQQKLAILQHKRTEDKAKIKELEKFRAQLQQMMDYKAKWSESQAELQQMLKAAKKECREAMLAKEKVEEEMRELSDAVEMTTVDREMAEERSESLQTENEVLKEKIEELTIDLEIIKQEISESGVEGAASSAQLKQLEQQNSRLKEALMRLRDLSAQDKLEHQRVVKDLEKHTSVLQLLRDEKEKVDHELQESHAIIDELQEQVDVALGAEEMVETLTDKNLELEDKIEQLNETINDLEALRDLSEEQEELRVEVEHELREEIDMTQNSIRQMERKLDAGQETIIDQQQTIEKFRELVQHLQADLSDLKQQGKTRVTVDAPETADQAQAVASLNIQLKSTAIKAHSRTIDFELRKLDAQQAMEQINLLKSFMPNTFIISGGDYDALLVLMLLPRLVFKAELIADQLKQQHKLEEALSSISTVSASQADQLAFVCMVIYKLFTLQMLVSRASSILCECDVQLYRQMGGLRDDLVIHEKALDILIELLKKELLDENVPLHGLEKAIGHFETLLQTRLVPVESGGHSEQLLSQLKSLSAGCDYLTMEMLRTRALAPEGSLFVTQLKELESFNNDLRQVCRKVRRQVPSPDSQHMVRYDSSVVGSLEKAMRRQLLLSEALKSLHFKVSLKASSLTESESLTTGELEEFIRQVATSRSLRELLPGGGPAQPIEVLRTAVSTNSTTMEKFLGALQDGDYDAEAPKAKHEAPVVVRARAVKAELSDTEGLRFKLEERQQNILELKMTLKLKAQELSEANVKIGLLDKKVEQADSECAKKVEVEREDVRKFKAAMDEQERKFNRTIDILHGDIETKENEKIALEKRLAQQTKKTILTDIAVGRRTIGERTSPYSGSPYGSPFGSPYTSRRVQADTGAELGEGEGADKEMMEGAARPVIQDSPLLLAKIESLKKALGYSQDENFRLKAQIAKAQLTSLPPLSVPQRLIHTRRGGGSTGGGEEGEGESANQTDQEKSVMKETANLMEELSKMAACPRMIDITKPKEVGKGREDAGLSPREKLANQLASVLEMQRRKQKLQEEGKRLLGGHFPGGLVSTRFASFTSPQFSKALGESTPSVLSARIRLPPTSGGGRGCSRGVHRVVISPEQFEALHAAIVS